ncbi:MAG: M24 family metallopeptidase [Acidobacteriota bacterium]|nr:M24 family metallopeptidase [Acidobacteriota bacterium]
MIKTKGFTIEELDKFREFQGRSFVVLEATAENIRPGMTEREAARRLRKVFHEDGVHTYFHVPVALFGSRTAYPGDFGKFEALATERILLPGETVILDAAPIYDGYTVDTSYAFTLEPNETFRRLDGKLPELRDLILNLTRTRCSMQKICWTVDDKIKEWGMENCHRKHIAAVMGHRVNKTSSAFMRRARIWGLAPLEVGYFLLSSRLAGYGLRRATPNWNHTAACDVAPQPGLWAIEPHLGQAGVGVKFEEILVVTETDAYWLDNDLPHHRRWRQ